MFFDTRSFQETKLSLETVREWAGSIANEYLLSGTLPTQALCKIAQVEELTPPQIEMVAAEANKLIHTQKHASMKDKYFAADFPHANAKEVIGKLQASGGGVKLAAQLLDPIFKPQGPDEHAMFGIKPEVMDKTASVRRELKDAYEKVALLKQKTEDRLFLLKSACADAEREFIKKARQMVLSSANSPTERLQVIGSIDHFVKCAGMRFARTSLAKLAHVLKQEGLLLPQSAEETIDYFMSKEADVKAPDELISPWISARVVNGNHPLYITLKTFRDATQEARDCSHRYNLIHDQVEMVKQRIRAL